MRRTGRSSREEEEEEGTRIRKEHNSSDLGFWVGKPTGILRMDLRAPFMPKGLNKDSAKRNFPQAMPAIKHPAIQHTHQHGMTPIWAGC